MPARTKTFGVRLTPAELSAWRVLCAARRQHMTHRVVEMIRAEILADPPARRHLLEAESAAAARESALE